MKELLRIYFVASLLFYLFLSRASSTTTTTYTDTVNLADVSNDSRSATPDSVITSEPTTSTSTETGRLVTVYYHYEDSNTTYSLDIYDVMSKDDEIMSGIISFCRYLVNDTTADSAASTASTEKANKCVLDVKSTLHEKRKGILSRPIALDQGSESDSDSASAEKERRPGRTYAVVVELNGRKTELLLADLEDLTIKNSCTELCEKELGHSGSSKEEGLDSCVDSLSAQMNIIVTNHLKGMPPTTIEASLEEQMKSDTYYVDIPLYFEGTDKEPLQLVFKYEPKAQTSEEAARIGCVQYKMEMGFPADITAEDLEAKCVLQIQGMLTKAVDAALEKRKGVSENSVSDAPPALTRSGAGSASDASIAGTYNDEKSTSVVESAQVRSYGHDVSILDSIPGSLLFSLLVNGDERNLVIESASIEHIGAAVSHMCVEDKMLLQSLDLPPDIDIKEGENIIMERCIRPFVQFIQSELNKNTSGDSSSSSSSSNNLADKAPSQVEGEEDESDSDVITVTIALKVRDMSSGVAEERYETVDIAFNPNINTPLEVATLFCEENKANVLFGLDKEIGDKDEQNLVQEYCVGPISAKISKKMNDKLADIDDKDENSISTSSSRSKDGSVSNMRIKTLDSTTVTELTSLGFTMEEIDYMDSSQFPDILNHVKRTLPRVNPATKRVYSASDVVKEMQQIMGLMAKIEANKKEKEKEKEKEKVK